MSDNKPDKIKIDDVEYTRTPASPPAQFVGTDQTDPFVGKYVICRCYSAGVHAGVVVSQVGDVVYLAQSRRLWSWKAMSGVALSGVAVSGLDNGCKVDSTVGLIRLTGVIETLLCSKDSEVSIRDY